MKGRNLFVFVIALTCVLQRTQAEPYADLLDDYAIEKNAAQNFKAAQLVVLGKFRPVASKYQSRGYVDVEFQVEKLIVGKKTVPPVLHLRLPFVMLAATEQAVVSQPRQQEVDAALASQKTLETLFEQRRLTRVTFQALSQHNTRLLVRSADYLRKFVLVPLLPNEEDGPGRYADVVLNFGESVIFMMGSAYSEKDAPQLLYPNRVDFYPASDARIRRLVGLK